ncbi:T-box-containing protein TBX6L [Rhipicephalus sanguineus]|uniref:T-box-containing protein TBX6L n=1 Tax=Rhipicephalus sanguineus TaxID=34632 RepID=UPI0020C23248|nr:T-box-containing protein TBX6L [Rhipicephalus sanguineus]
MKANEQALSSMLPVLPSTTALASSFQPWISEPLKPVIHQAQFPCPELADVHVTLENSELWTRFYAIGNEMIITRPGRRMFPVMRVKVSGMVASSYYMMLMDLVPTDNYRYRFLSNCWLPVETATDSSPGETAAAAKCICTRTGPASAASGCWRPWTSAPSSLPTRRATPRRRRFLWQSKLSFEERCQCPMMLQSMRKYVPRIHVFAGSDVQKLDFRSFKTFVFPETGFISVTSYQNDQIITLKIQNNPYARSFCSNTERR